MGLNSAWWLTFISSFSVFTTSQTIATYILTMFSKSTASYYLGRDLRPRIRQHILARQGALCWPQKLCASPIFDTMRWFGTSAELPYLFARPGIRPCNHGEET